MALLLGTADATPAASHTEAGVPLDLYLEVFVNGASSDLIGAFRQEPDGRFTAEPEELREVGIEPAPAAAEGGRIVLDRLPGVTYDYDPVAQVIRFESAVFGRAARVIDARETTPVSVPTSPSALGGLLNYSILASTRTGGFDDLWAPPHLSATLEPRLFGRFGVLDHAMIVSSDEGAFGGVRRLATTWSMTDVERMRTYRVGDVVTGALSWTRPVRLGGVQVQSDFDLRSDLVTFPLPSLAGSAAVPSTVDVFVDNARRYSTDVPAGPFEIAQLPVVEGGGTARIVVRDPQGVETVTEQAFFASTRLLSPGLLDYSAELGLARLDYGLRSDVYDDRLMGTGTVRYGFSPRLTLEGHAEGGDGLAQIGGGAVFGLGRFGVGGLSVAGSHSDSGTGVQLAGQAEVALGDVVFNARTQRTFGHFDDIASVTADPDPKFGPLVTARPPRALDQLSLSVPFTETRSSVTFSFTNLETEFGDQDRLAGFSFSQTLARDATVYASGFASLDGRDIGLFAGLSMPLGPRHTASVTALTDDRSLDGFAELSRSSTRTIGDYGWRVRAGSDRLASAAVTYNSAPARLEAGIDSFGGDVRASARAEGAVVAAGGGLHFGHRVDDAFALVDIGVADIEVLSQNRPVGRTGRAGRILVPDLRANEMNDLSFDPVALPLDSAISATRRTVVPPSRSGVVVDFAVSGGGGAALVSFRRPDGSFVEAGSPGRLFGGEAFTVGYDGQAFLGGLSASNEAVIEDGLGPPCRARFPFAADEAEQPMIADVACRPLSEDIR